MNRYLKVKGKWIDTLEEQKQGQIYYLDKDDNVYYYIITDESDIGYKVGKLEDSSNIKITDTLDSFFEDKQNKGYKSYLKYCEERSITPVKKSVFRKRQPKESKR